MSGSTRDGLRFLKTVASVQCEKRDDYGWCTEHKEWCSKFPACPYKVWVRGDKVVRDGSKPLVRGKQMFGTPQY